MKVLLLKDVRDVGRKNEVKEVNDGFARNFLFAKKLAILATESKMHVIEAEKAGKEKKQETEQKKYQDIADHLKSIEVTIAIKVGEKGKAFGSVGVHQIKKALDQQKIEIDENWIVLKEPIKTTGSKQVPLKFPHDISGFITIVIKPEE